jgi:putative endonuclease
MKDKNKVITGKEGERKAVAFLSENGYRICETNFRCPIGEIDIIAKDKNTLVFIEVKTRKSEELGYPEEAVEIKKQRKMFQLALWYLQQKKVADTDARFDVIAITLLPQGEEIKLIRNAFDLISY